MNLIGFCSLINLCNFYLNYTKRYILPLKAVNPYGGLSINRILYVKYSKTQLYVCVVRLLAGKWRLSTREVTSIQCEPLWNILSFVKTPWVLWKQAETREVHLKYTWSTPWAQGEYEPSHEYEPADVDSLYEYQILVSNCLSTSQEAYTQANTHVLWMTLNISSLVQYWFLLKN